VLISEAQPLGSAASSLDMPEGDVFEVPAAAVLVADLEQRIVHVEGGAFGAHGLRTDAWVGQRLQDVLPAATLPILIPRYQTAITGVPQSFAYWTRDGTRAYWVQITPVREREAAVTSVVAVIQDITERLHATADLTRSEARLREAERIAGVGGWELALSSTRLTFSPGFAHLIGLALDAPLDREAYLEHVHPADRDAVLAAAAECVRAGSATCEYRIIRPDGSQRTLSSRAELVIGEDGRHESLRGAVLDVTEQREAERERSAAEHLFRQGFDSAPIGMLLSDPVDGRCVRVNDAMCEMLQRTREDILGETITEVTPPEDHARLNRARGDIVAGRSRGFQGEQRYVRPDGGIAWGLLHLSPVRAADGSIQAFHAQIVDITERKEREVRLEQDVSEAAWLGRIRAALDEDRFVLYAQPIVDLITGKTVQHELLLRMRGEDGSIISPAHFLPAAERYGLISEIDRWVIRQAVAIAAGGTPAEFNLSGRSIGDPAVLGELAAAIQSSGVDPALIVVEVTETAFVGDTEAGREFAQRVRELGCRLALDDFGTGFSSLSYLKHLPADHLKIDIEFVRELTTSETDARVIRGIVGLAREFNQTTIAEGVEDEATLMMLKELGVDQAQGYLLGRPAPRDDAPPSASPAGRPEPRGAADPVGATDPRGTTDPIAIVETAFAHFAARDVDALLSHCRPDVVLRAFATSELAERGEPYRGHEGMRTYMHDVATVWDELSLTPLMFRQARGSVIGFGRAEARRGEQTVLASVLWVVRLEQDQVSSIEVFQAVGGTPSMSVSQARRLADSPALSRR
jgi:PAS domain S-box-containing protein